ncbi:sugar ABC transporter permease [uncultured Jatrophihabitans sp.]|uniref:sugar ABC transporter permease n=1 Tax=uncultured Jatrophihabitans sp. TaxID=1610747 RepID=UPI0035CA49B8
MTDVTTNKATPPPTLLDRSDERVAVTQGVGGAVRNFGRRVRAGDLGALPVIVGLVIICIVFQALNTVFLSANNLVNLLFDSCSVGVISLGIVCVLMLGEIDLSVGSVSGLSSAILGVLWVNHGAPVLLAIVIAAVSGLVIGAVYAVLFTRFGMPSFVATLAGLLAFLGLQLNLLGQKGSINLPYGSAVTNFGQLNFMPPVVAYILAAVVAAGIFASGLRTITRRRSAGLSAKPLSVLITQSVAVLVVLEFVVWYLDRDRGVAWMFGVFAALVIVMHYAFTRTKWGRSVTAVGGNREAARRAGIKVDRIYLSCFMLCSLFAAIGGILGAARLASSSQSAGTGDVNLNAIAAAVIGGTSLFGGRGNAYSALLGVLVIQAIASGLTLLNLSSSLRFMITGAVLAVAVLVDSLARRSRAAHGAA